MAVVPVLISARKEVGKLPRITDQEMADWRNINLYNDSSLDRSPKKNWVEKRGGLPPNVRARARAIKRKNPSWPLSRCIATAINANKLAASTGGELEFHGKQKDGPAALSRHVEATAHWEAMKGSKGRKGKK